MIVPLWRVIRDCCAESKARTVFAYLSFSLTFFAPVFCATAQAQQRDLPDMPDAQPGSDSSNAGSADRVNSSSSSDSLSFRERLRRYERSFIKPESLLGPVFGAAVGQARNTPPEWGQGSEGFGMRMASGYGRSVIARTIALGVESLDREDSRYTPSHESGIWRRGWYATTRTFVSRAPGGGSMPAYGRFAGVYGAAFIANYWEPPSQANTAHALQRGSTALLSSVGWRIFEEFWPDLRQKVLRRPN